MSILIKGMEMPKDCRECPFETYYFNCGETRCRATRRTLATDFKTIPFDGRADDCPLIELPPHGRLIDADALDKWCEGMRNIEWNNNAAPYSWSYAYESFQDDIKDAPTVIEAEEDGK